MRKKRTKGPRDVLDVSWGLYLVRIPYPFTPRDLWFLGGRGRSVGGGVDPRSRKGCCQVGGRLSYLSNNVVSIIKMRYLFKKTYQRPKRRPRRLLGPFSVPVPTVLVIVYPPHHRR